MRIQIRVTGYKGIYNVRTGFVDKQDRELTAKMCGSPQAYIFRVFFIYGYYIQHEAFFFPFAQKSQPYLK
jgi:hypothetical protein